MQLNIKNAEVVALANEVAALAGQSKTEAIRVALVERRDRLKAVRDGRAQRRFDELGRLLKNAVWPHIPDGERGREMSVAEVEEALGFGPDGV